MPVIKVLILEHLILTIHTNLYQHLCHPFWSINSVLNLKFSPYLTPLITECDGIGTGGQPGQWNQYLVLHRGVYRCFINSAVRFIGDRDKQITNILVEEGQDNTVLSLGRDNIAARAEAAGSELTSKIYGICFSDCLHLRSRNNGCWLGEKRIKPNNRFVTKCFLISKIF